MDLPIQFEDVAKAAWSLEEALGNKYGGGNKNRIQWDNPRESATDFVRAVQKLRRALEAAAKVVATRRAYEATIKETRGKIDPVMVENTIELGRRLEALNTAHGRWGAPDEPLPAEALGAVRAPILREARGIHSLVGGDVKGHDRQVWRVETLENRAKRWAYSARNDENEAPNGVPLGPIYRAGNEAWAEAAATARRDEGENDDAVRARLARAEAEREASAKAFRESYEREQAERKAEAARKLAEAEADMSRVEEAIRSGNASLKSVRDGGKRKYLINVTSAKGEKDARGYLKQEAFAIEGRVWWPLGVSRHAEEDGKGGHQASKKRAWSVSFLPVGLQVGSAFSVKEAEDMAKALAPRFREVANVGEVRSDDTAALSPLSRIVNEYNERKRVNGETVKREREQAEREQAEREREGLPVDFLDEPDDPALARRLAERAEREQAEREREQAERTERLRKQAEREQEKQALYEQSGRDYVARTEAEHREQRERARKQREREREREHEHEQAERERVALAERGAWRDSQDAKRRERRDKAADKATMSRAWAAVDNAKDLASWLEALERIDRQARADGGPGASASVLIDGLPLGLDVLVFALSGQNEEAVQATFDEVASQNPQFARALRRAMVAQRGKVSAAMLASSLRRRVTLAKQTGLALGPPEPVSQGVKPAKAPKRRNLARNVAELGLRMLAMRKEPQRGPAYLPDSVPGASSERTGRKARKKSEDMAKKKSETETAKPAKPAKKEGRTGVSVKIGNLYRVIVGREMVDAEVVDRDEQGWILKRLPFVTAARAWEEGRQLRGRRSTEELKQCACVFDKENGA